MRIILNNVKKPVSLLLTLGLILSLFSSAFTVSAVDAEKTNAAPVTAGFAVEAKTADLHENHCFCGGTFDGTQGHVCDSTVEWQAIDANATTLPTSGNWYLTGDLSLASGPTFFLTGDMHLCFNGHTVTVTAPGRAVYGISSAVTTGLNISFCDCQGAGGISHQK